MSFFWSEQDIEKVAELLKKGYSAGKIGPHFGKSRNAIVGLVHRHKTLRALGFMRSPGGQKEIVLKPKQEAKPKAPKPVPAPKPVVVHVVPEPPFRGRMLMAGRPLANLGRFECRFAVNDAERGEQHLFCGTPTNGGRWCAHHKGRVFKGVAA